MDKFIARIQHELGIDHLFNKLSAQLSASDLNSFLLELFRSRSANLSPADVLTSFENNRFVRPSSINPVHIRELELHCLKLVEAAGFKPLELSPVAPFGSCSVLAHVNQNNVLSALRGTEVVSDVTNIMALKIAQDFKFDPHSKELINYASVHRHVRCQFFDNPNFSAHFSVLGLATGGKDRGDFNFEIREINRHLQLLLRIIQSKSTAPLSIRFFMKRDSQLFLKKFRESVSYLNDHFEYVFVDDFDNQYYQKVQFKINLKIEGGELNIGDGGLVDWTQKLLSNRKQRLCISGLGLDLFYKLSHGELV